MRSVDSRYISKILDKVRKLADFPDVQADIIDLKGGNNQGRFRMRIGFYRVLFEVIDGEPKIIEIQEIRKRDDQTYRKH